jgi:DNA mismatch endonuclease (patch repair protein)
MAKAQSPLYIDVSAATRRRMQAVRGEDTTPEMRVRRLLHAMGYRFRLHVKKLPGSPDIVLPKYKKIVLVHGCFWHGHMDCRRSKLPANNSATWRAKIASNQARG